MAVDSEPPEHHNKHVKSKINFFDLLWDQGVVTEEMLKYDYSGSGTPEDPYAVTWIPNDPRNPMLWSMTRKWVYTSIMALATLAVSFISSAYTGAVEEILMQFRADTEVITLGVSLFVLYGIITSGPRPLPPPLPIRNIFDYMC